MVAIIAIVRTIIIVVVIFAAIAAFFRVTLVVALGERREALGVQPEEAGQARAAQELRPHKGKQGRGCMCSRRNGDGVAHAGEALGHGSACACSLQPHCCGVIKEPKYMWARSAVRRRF